MASTSISDAVVWPQDDGTGVADGSEDFDSAGYFGLLSQATDQEYKVGMALSSLDTTNETVDVASGHCYITESGNTVQSGAQTTYDTTLPSGSDMMYLVIFPTSTTVSLDADTDATLEVVVDPTSQDSVTIEHNTTPTDPSLVIGSADSTGGGNGTSESNAGPLFDESNIDHDSLSNFVANEHIDHSTVDITAGNALTGGGDLTTTRTINVDESAIDIANLAGVLADAIIKSTGDNLEWQVDVNDDLILRNTTDNITLLTWDQDSGDITFEQLTGTPSFASHDHSEAGLTAVPNAGLVNSSVTIAGNSVSLGGSTGISIDDLSDVQSTTESAGDLPVWHNTNSRYENAALTGGDGIGVTNADASVTLAAALAASGGLKFASGEITIEPNDFAGTSLEDDGADNLRIASSAAGDGLKGGGASALAVEPNDFAGKGHVDDGSDNLAHNQIATGTVTASGGSTPAVDTVLADVSSTQTLAYRFILYVEGDPAFNADYAYNYEFSHAWDDSDSSIDIDLTVNWDTDPGAGNDVTLRWEVIEE